MNRREAILGVSIIPLIPYIGGKYKTPLGYVPYEKLTSTGWEEYPFDEFQAGDIVRRIDFREEPYKVLQFIRAKDGYCSAIITDRIKKGA